MAYTGITNKSITDYIGIVKIDGTEYLTGSTLFGICKTAANEAIKDVEIEDFSGFSPTHGLTIHVLFYYNNTANNPSLRIGGTGSSIAKYTICATRGHAAGTTIADSWREGAIVSLTFVDSRYDDDNTTTSSGETDLTNSYWLINSSMDTGADPTSTVNWDNVTGASDLHAIEDLDDSNNAATGYLKRTGANTWTLQTGTDATSAVAGITTVGASGGAAAFTHAHGNITSDGKMSGTTVTSSDAVTTTHKFLREDGTWIEPAYTTNTDTKVKQTVTTSANDYTILFSESTNSSGTTTLTEGARKHNLLRYNPGSHTLSIGDGNNHTGTLTATQYSGNAATATDFASAKTIALTGNVTGAASGGNSNSGWSISTTIANNAVTNDMLAGSITPAKLDSTATIGIGTQSIKVGNSFNTSTLLDDLGLSTALRFVGVTTTDMTGGNDATHTYTGTPTVTGKTSYTPVQGDVVINSTKNDEWVCISTDNSTYQWERLGSDVSYKIVQSAVSDPTVPESGITTSNSFIATINQNTQGVITVTKLNVPVTSVAGKTGAITLGPSDVGLGNVSNVAQVTNITWDGTNNKLRKTIGATTSDIVTASTLKSAMSLNKVTNHAQVTSLQWNTSSKKITYKISEGNATDLLQFDEGSNITLTAESGKITIAGTANNAVSQTIDSSEDTFPVLFSDNKTSETTTIITTGAKRNNSVYIQPSSGTITATKFSGDGSGLNNVTASSVAWGSVTGKVLAKLYVNTTAAGTNSNVATANNTTYIHLYDNSAVQDTIKITGSGNISVSSTDSKVITIAATAFTGATASANGTAGYLAAPGKGNQGKFLQGSGSWKTLGIPTIATVANGILTITNVALSVT